MTTPTLALDADRAAVAGRVIAAMAGPEARLRPDQETAVAALCEDAARVLVVQATGWGKSAVYWAATAVRRSEGAGPTLVVSPLLSLMRDQVAAAARAGLRAATVNSANIDDWSGIERDLVSGALDVLLVSPERLANPGFGRRVLDALTGRLGLVVIDEAHAVSDWGHDFRPDYRRVSDVLQRLLPTTPVLATTATANARVTDDVAAQLGETTLVLRGPLARASLQLAVVDPGRGDGYDRLSPLDRYAWVVDHLPRLPGSGIIYTLTVADAHRLAEAIASVHPDLPVAAYTGQLDGAQREKLEDALLANEVKALVATSALGMGYDKPDLGFVVHVGAPPSPVSYYQQVGRAGRALDHALAVLLPSEADDRVWEYFATATIPVPAQVEAVLAVLAAAGESMSVPALEAETGVRRTRVELLLKQLAVEGVVERGEAGWSTTGKEWTFDAEHYDGVIAVRRREADIMRSYTRSESCLMQLLQRSLDDPTAEPCGRCSACLGALPTGLEQRPSVETRRAVAAVLRTQRHAVEPRKMWPGGAFGSRGRIAAGEIADPGRALVHADAPEWSELVAQVFARDAEAPEELRDAVVGVLADWRGSWAERPETVVGLAASGFPRLVGSLVDHVAERGRLQPAGVLDLPAPSGDLSSAEEAAWWRDQLLAATAPPVEGQVVLLVVDASSSLWPVTVVTSWLRRAGARRVLPLLVHRRA
ncbi:RecQ family ATP-dependent DNA helicase [Nocardioides massiliensis]|uniref:DNA 3'-5' helicase n=1 Tax=Nocardioides massiliensis TaxID=1325935 RepID=A0ABT9NSZ0_9ACTN|nr:DEAD/DEAH box helicase [Nocardioides massiliensis]MDP9823538.1 ATP-dependent DNA helicase RecQ [Nocardioides massiliensis]